MALQVAVALDYVHDRYLGRPSCPKCGHLLMAPEASAYLDDQDIRHSWHCEGCDFPFETRVTLQPAAA